MRLLPPRIDGRQRGRSSKLGAILPEPVTNFAQKDLCGSNAFDNHLRFNVDAFVVAEIARSSETIIEPTVGFLSSDAEFSTGVSPPLSGCAPRRPIFHATNVFSGGEVPRPSPGMRIAFILIELSGYRFGANTGDLSARQTPPCLALLHPPKKPSTEGDNVK